MNPARARPKFIVEKEENRATHPICEGVGARPVLYFLLPNICVVTVAELLARLGSKFDEFAAAVFVIDVLFVDPETFTVMVMVVEAPTARFPRLQVIVPTCPTAGDVQDAPPDVNETNVDGAGTGSFKVTAAARKGPRFFTLTV